MYKKALSGWMKHLDFIIIDIVCLEISLFLACLIRYRFDAIENLLNYRVLCMLLPVLLLVIAMTMPVYDNIIRRGKGRELLCVLQIDITTYFLLFTCMFMLKITSQYSRIVIMLSAVISFVFMLTMHLIWKNILQKRLLNFEEKRQIVVAASSEWMDELVQSIHKYEIRRQICGLMYEDDCSACSDKFDVIHSDEDLISYCTRHVVDEVIIQMKDLKRLGDLSRSLIDMGIPVHVGMSFIMLPNMTVGRMGNCTVVTSSINSISTHERVVKRIIDILGSLVGLAFTAVLFVIFAPIIYIQSPGPVFFKQQRVGTNGRKFYLYKFRSMYMDAEERKKELMEQNQMKGLMFKMDNDPRIIPIGHFLRSSSIDEFPQFINVLKGDMSLVGTRPPTVDEYERYEPHHKKRLALKPGITGLWQVSGRSNITDFEEVVRLDTEYIETWSHWNDIKILARTIKVVLMRIGSK